MKIATFNANSIRSRLPILLQWLEDHEPDVLGIQETKAQDVDYPRGRRLRRRAITWCSGGRSRIMALR